MKYDRIVELKKKEAQKNLRIAKFEVENMLKKGESINVTVLSERTGFSRSYFYRNREAAQLVKQAQKKEEHILKTHAGIVHISEDIEEKLIDLRIEIIRLKRIEILRKKLRDVGYEI